jgi:hypothetical protein
MKTKQLVLWYSKIEVKRLCLLTSFMFVVLSDDVDILFVLCPRDL